ncbi:MAG: hypothetical protein ACKVRO_02900 [Micropepsaceae bacterium]
MAKYLLVATKFFFVMCVCLVASGVLKALWDGRVDETLSFVSRDYLKLLLLALFASALVALTSFVRDKKKW